MYTVYFIYDFIKKVIVYVGCTRNLKIRIQQHVDGVTKLKLTSEELKTLKFFTLQSKLKKYIALSLEFFVQKKFAPLYNTAHEFKNKIKMDAHVFKDILDSLNTEPLDFKEFTDYSYKNRIKKFLGDEQVFIHIHTHYQNGNIKTILPERTKICIVSYMSCFGYKNINNILNLNLTDLEYMDLWHEYKKDGQYLALNTTEIKTNFLYTGEDIFKKDCNLTTNVKFIFIKLWFVLENSDFYKKMTLHEKANRICELALESDKKERLPNTILNFSYSYFKEIIEIFKNFLLSIDCVFEDFNHRYTHLMLLQKRTLIEV